MKISVLLLSLLSALVILGLVSCQEADATSQQVVNEKSSTSSSETKDESSSTTTTTTKEKDPVEPIEDTKDGEVLEEKKEETKTESTDEEITSKSEAKPESETKAQADEAATKPTDTSTNKEAKSDAENDAPVQAGPLVDLLGPTLLSLEMIDGSRAALKKNYTNDALRGKKVIGIYFSADWCGPCRQFTPELVSFYKKMNGRRGRENEFEIVWVSRCRDFKSFGQYFTQMNWIALPFEEATGKRGEMLSNMYKVKGIPTLVLLDDLGQVITTDARNKIPQDKAGIGFPWRNPLSTLYITIVPKSIRYIIKTQIDSAKAKFVGSLKSMVGMSPKQAKKTSAAAAVGAQK